MSLFSFLKSLWEALTGKNKKIANISYEIIEAIKKADSNANPLELVLSVIPEKLHEKFLINAVSILKNAGLIQTQNLTVEEAIVEAATYIRKIKGSLNHKIGLNSLFMFVASVLADGKISWDDLPHLGAFIFKKRNEVQALDNEPLSGNDTDNDGIDDWEDDDADGDGIDYLTDPNDPRHGRP